MNSDSLMAGEKQRYAQRIETMENKKHSTSETGVFFALGRAASSFESFD